MIQRLLRLESLNLFLQYLDGLLVVYLAKMLAIGTGGAPGHVRPVGQRERAK